MKTIEVLTQRKGMLEKITAGLNSKFKGQDDFESRFEIYADDVAQSLGLIYDGGWENPRFADDIFEYAIFDEVWDEYT